ncbi:hypothetical protein EYF80_038252 [Liparis tanakae]|uniref:Uncharacterized protein n=1 Tax=Liparis tanakae TaxID=230148 RepID=A0A4Z2GF93_9TELE|nr:hypothetical protein EYF80_038252 [Liparis tanakae]
MKVRVGSVVEVCFGQGGKTGEASVVFSYLRVDLKDRALRGERRRESDVFQSLQNAKPHTGGNINRLQEQRNDNSSKTEVQRFVFTDLRTNFEVILPMIPVEVPLRC